MLTSRLWEIWAGFFRYRRPALQEAEGDDKFTDLPDMITGEDGPNKKRFKMPCGHAISPESLTQYCRSILNDGKYRIPCPWVDPKDATKDCPHEWQYIVVRRLGVLTESEEREFEQKISENYLRREANIQECPGCKSYCLRKSNLDKRMVCPVCSKPEKNYEFCWRCLNIWRTLGTTECGNEICSGKDTRIPILANAPEKEIVGVPGVPGCRACIKCGVLIEHMNACKHMKCVCEQEFCFICLKPRVNGQWQCGSFNTKCAVAPRQTKLPGE